MGRARSLTYPIIYTPSFQGVNSRGVIWAGCNGEGAGAFDGRVWVNTLKQHDRWENLSNRVVHSVGHLGDGTVVLGRPGGLTFLR